MENSLSFQIHVFSPLVVSRDLVKPRFSIPLTRHTSTTILSPIFSFLDFSQPGVGLGHLVCQASGDVCRLAVGAMQMTPLPSVSTGALLLWHQLLKQLPGISCLWFPGASIQIPCLGLRVLSEQLEREPGFSLGRRCMLNTEHRIGHYSTLSIIHGPDGLPFFPWAC